jgi:hypothetical protein
VCSLCVFIQYEPSNNSVIYLYEASTLSRYTAHFLCVECAVELNVPYSHWRVMFNFLSGYQSHFYGKCVGFERMQCIKLIITPVFAYTNRTRMDLLNSACFLIFRR